MVPYKSGLCVRDHHRAHGLEHDDGYTRREMSRRQRLPRRGNLCLSSNSGNPEHEECRSTAKYGEVQGKYCRKNCVDGEV